MNRVATTPPENRMLPFMFGIEARFNAFHSANPKVYAKLVELARKAKARGFQRYSIDGLFHLVRWHYNIEIQREPRDEFELNNDFTSRYSRLIMEQEVDLADFFETRVLKSA